MATRRRGSSKKFGIKKNTCNCWVFVKRLSRHYQLDTTTSKRSGTILMKSTRKNMTTLTAMQISQKERNKNRHKPEEAHRHRQPHRHTKDRHPLVDKNKKLFGLFAQNQATWKVTTGLLKRRKGKWAPRPLCIHCTRTGILTNDWWREKIARKSTARSAKNSHPFDRRTERSILRYSLLAYLYP